MPLVLGLNATHADSSAVLVNEKGMIAAICEERINRKKHSADFPALAVQEVLRIAGASISDVTDLAIAKQPKANLSAKLAFVARNPRVGISVAKARLGVQRTLRNAGASLAESLGVNESQFKAREHRVEHHLAHIASSFFWSPFERAVGISVDGSGDFATAMIARCEGRDIKILHRSYLPNSLGIYYTGVCHFLGFNKYGEEYKVMGLSAYGEDRYAEQMAKLVSYTPGRGIHLNQKYFRTYTDINSAEAHLFQVKEGGEIVLPQPWSEAMKELFGEPRNRKSPLTQRENDVACSMQRHFERCYLALVRDAIDRNGGLKDAVLAGGCALNGVANGLVMQNKLIDRIYMQPAASDDGTAAGAASYILHSVLGVPRTPEVNHAYWGTGWTDEQIERDVKASGMPFKKLDRDTLMKTAVDSLCRGKIMGWFQGREEWGPRALGNRSIICNPNWPDMKAILNARIKNREAFRPFAPAILFDKLSTCFEGDHEVPFMNIVYKVRPEWRERLSAVTHEDNTGRVQSVRREQNPMYYDLIKGFEARTGIPVLLNTSFNENEPIVHTPAQAIACFARTKMDCLAVGPFWYEKPAEMAAKAEIIGEE